MTSFHWRDVKLNCVSRMSLSLSQLPAYRKLWGSRLKDIMKHLPMNTRSYKERDASCCLQLLSGRPLFMEECIPVCAHSHSPLLLLSHNYAVRYKALLCAIKAGLTQQYPKAMNSDTAHNSTGPLSSVFLLCTSYQSWNIRWSIHVEPSRDVHKGLNLNMIRINQASNAAIISILTSHLAYYWLKVKKKSCLWGKMIVTYFQSFNHARGKGWQCYSVWSLWLTGVWNLSNCMDFYGLQGIHIHKVACIIVNS